MIFTRRFGALRARPTFPRTPEAKLEEEVQTLLRDANDVQVASNDFRDASDDDLRDEPAA